MTKNMTRKGLALGSIAALVIGSFVGAAPAQANPSISLGAAYGSAAQKAATSLHGIAGKTFDLVAVSSNEADLRFYIEGIDAASLDIQRADAATLTTNASTAIADTLTVAADLAALNGTAGGSLEGKLDDSDGDDLAVVVNPKITAGNLAQLRIGLNGITETTTITITPFLDTTPRDGQVSAADFKGTPITLTFHKASEVTATATLKAPVIGATEVAATVTLDKDINSASIPSSSVTVSFQKDGAAIGATQPATWSGAEGVWNSTSASTTVTASTEVFSAQAKVDGATSGGNISLGSAAIGTAATIVDGTLSFKTSGNVTLSASGNNAELKAGAGSVEVSTKITAVAGKALAGQKVTYTFTESSLRAAASITVDGKTLTRTSTPDNIKVDALTDADGVAKVTVNYTGFATTGTADKVTVSSSVLGASAVISSATEDMTAVAVATTEIVEASNIGTGANRAIAKGGSSTVELHIVDQFGQPVAAERRVVLSIGNVTGSNVEATVIGSVVTSTGTANATVVDSSTGSTGTYDLVASVQRKNAAGNWESDSLTSVTVVSFVMGGGTAATVTTTPAIAASAAQTGYIDLQTVDMVANDGRKLALSPVTYDVASGDFFVISGNVRAANGVGVAGVPVTIAAPGAGFATGTTGSAVFATDSITVMTGAAGAYSVNAFSNKAGKVDYTVTSGAASATTTAYFESAARTAGRTLVIDAPAAVAPGSTLVVKATLVDKYGNPVSANNTATSDNVVVSYDGPGLPITAPTAFVNGAMQFGVLLGANDRGTATVTVSVYLGTAKVSVQKSIVIGTAGNVGDYANWTKKLDDNSAKMYAKNVVGAGKVQFFLNGREIAWVRATSAADPKLLSANGANYIVRTVTFAAGKNVLEVYVDGVRTARTAYTKR